jgi:hypothetical protein
MFLLTRAPRRLMDNKGGKIMEEQNENAGAKEQGNKPQDNKELDTKVYIKIGVGLVLVILGAWAILGWWHDLMTLVKGSVGLFFILAGAVTIAIAKE